MPSHADDLLSYLTRCGGKDILAFSDHAAACKARDRLLQIADDEEIDPRKIPLFVVFDKEVHVTARTQESAGKAVACGKG